MSESPVPDLLSALQRSVDNARAARVSTLKDRLLARTDQDGPNGCWIWQGATANTYGIINRGSRGEGRDYVHRVSYELFIGPIPEGLHIDHLCRVRLCLNPDHLEAVTQTENNVRTRRETCINGHPFAGENLRIHASGQRLCVTCIRERARASWPDRKKGMAHVSSMVPDGLYAAAKAKAQEEGTSITMIVHQALIDFLEDA